jgi:hypothetical protein
VTLAVRKPLPSGHFGPNNPPSRQHRQKAAGCRQISASEAGGGSDHGVIQLRHLQEVSSLCDGSPEPSQVRFFLPIALADSSVSIIRRPLLVGLLLADKVSHRQRTLGEKSAARPATCRSRSRRKNALLATFHASKAAFDPVGKPASLTWEQFADHDPESCKNSLRWAALVDRVKEWLGPQNAEDVARWLQDVQADLQRQQRGPDGRGHGARP